MKQLFQLVICGFMHGYYSLRKHSEASRYDLRMIYLLHGKKVPSHTRFGDFIRNRLAGETMENLFYQLVMKLVERETISLENLFVDGTKIEANANWYSFVWEKVVGKASSKKDIELLESYKERQERYDAHKEILKGRPSYSKTDKDATFMRMKEDHMKNGQLKPGYNLQLGVEGEFIVTAGMFSERSDMLTLLPLLSRLKEKTGKTPKRLVADSGYESEENYTGLERMESEAYIKPSNYEKSKTRKYKANLFRADNMLYDEEKDSFTRPNGSQLVFQGTRHSKSKSGYVSEVSC